MAEKMSIPNILKQYQEMVAYGKSIETRKFTVPEFTKLLRGFVGSFDIKVKTSRNAEVDKNQIIIGGSYDPEEDAANCSAITIYVTYNPAQKKICIKDIDWKQLCIELIECSGHEVVHQTQYRLRGFDIGPNIFVSLSPEERKRTDQEYLGSPDEVEAYGFSIAVEIYLKYSTKSLTLKNIAKTPMFKAYVNAFGEEHKIVKELIEFVIDYYQIISENNHAKTLQEYIR